MATATERRTATRSPTTRRPPPRAKKGFFGRWLGRLALFLLFLTFCAVGAFTTALWYYGRGLPTVATLRAYHPPQVTRVLDRHGEVLDEIFTERRTVVSMDQVPRVLVLSVLAAEDADFYRHEGLDYPGLVRAVVRAALDGGRMRGTSTITQQIVKNLLLTPERSFERKVKELVLARRLERELSKDEILHLYLNHINFGHGRYGVEEASRFYFDKHVSELTLAEASLLAGIPKSPTHLSPRAHPDAARRRQLFVLGQLEDKRAEYWPDLSLEAIRAARDTAVRIAPVDAETEHAPEMMRLVRALLHDTLSPEARAHGGYTIHTTIDLSLQRQARRALRAGLFQYDERHELRGPIRAPRRRAQADQPRAIRALRVGRTYDAVVTGTSDERGAIELDVGGHAAIAEIGDLSRFNPEGLAPSEFASRGARVRVSVQHLPEGAEDGPASVRIERGPEGAIIAIDPRTRDVLALVGGSEAIEGFDRATQGIRQPGSTFKPIVYAQAIRSRKYTPATLVLDAPVVYDQWAPENYEAYHYQGAIRLREALAQSINLVAVRVMEDVTPTAVVDLASKLGITTPLDPTLSLSLGASAVHPAELVNVYATFAAGGRWAPLRFVTRIEGPDGRDIPLPALAAPHTVLSSAEAYVVTSLLESVIRTGTASAARRLNRPAAGKTGTSNEARDAWFVGYTTELVAGVWLGYDDQRPLGRRESGARTALPIWIDFIAEAEQGKRPLPFPEPAGVVHAAIDPVTGLLAAPETTQPLDEIFLDGTVPTQISPPPTPDAGVPAEPDASPFL